MTLWQRITARVGPRRVLSLMNLYPPYLGAGVRITRSDPDRGQVDVEMNLTPWNRNYMGTHFGGSLYSMCDPFYMFLVLQRLGDGYVVWDKSATIDFLRPGRGRVTARFELTDQRLTEIREEVERTGKCHPRFEVIVRDDQGETVARVGKVLSVRRRVGG